MTNAKGAESDQEHPLKYERIRFFKLVEVAYNCAQNEQYDAAAAVADVAADYHDDYLTGGGDE